MNARRLPLRRCGEAGEGTAMRLAGQLLSNGKASFWQIAGPWLLVAQRALELQETVKTEFPKMGQQDLLFLRMRGFWSGGHRRGSAARNRALGFTHSGPAQHPPLGRCDHVGGACVAFSGLWIQPNTLLLPSTRLPPSSPPFYSLGSQLTQRRAAEPCVSV